MSQTKVLCLPFTLNELVHVGVKPLPESFQMMQDMCSLSGTIKRERGNLICSQHRERNLLFLVFSFNLCHNSSFMLKCTRLAEEVVMKIAEVLEVPAQPNDIEIVHKLKRKGNKPIIFKFLSHKVKSKLYKSRAKLRNISVSNLFPTSTAATHVASDRIFLNENLTSYRRRIVNKANEMCRDGN